MGVLLVSAIFVAVVRTPLARLPRNGYLPQALGCGGLLVLLPVMPITIACALQNPHRMTQMLLML